jgi:glyoxylate utilization-related uncharacterized protein
MIVTPRIYGGENLKVSVSSTPFSGLELTFTDFIPSVQ